MRLQPKISLYIGAGLVVALVTAGCASQRTAGTPRTDGPVTARTNGPDPTQAERLNDAAASLRAMMDAPDQAIPQSLLDRAECVVVVPGVKEGAFIVGAQYGKGYLTCRQPGTQLGWTAPATVRVEGGSVGFQIGGKETDVIMLVMNEQGRNRILQSQFTVGADASVAAGPVGRTASADTDAYMTAQILTWARSRGAFAGVSLEGATLREDIDDNEALYGRRLSNRDLVEVQVQQMPQAAQQFIATINQYARRG